MTGMTGNDALRVVPPALKGVYDKWHFAPAVVCRGMVYCSGVIGTSPDGEPPAGALAGAQHTTRDDGAPLGALQAVRDPEAQFATAFMAVRAILNAAGADLDDIVELTSYHVDIDRHMPAFIRVSDGCLSPPWPAWTAVGVAGLVVPGGLVELRAIAALPGADATPV